jgi:hypothetical protein
MNFRYKSTFCLKTSFAKQDLTFKSVASKKEVLKKLEDLKQLLPPEADIKENPDLLYTYFNAAVVNLINLNGDGIQTETALSMAKYFKNKPMNIEHLRNNVVGYITNVGFSTFEDSKLLSESEVANLNEPFNIALAAIVWKHVDPSLANFLEEMNSDENFPYGDMSTSWEIGFNDYVIAVGSKNLSKAKLITDKAEIKKLDGYLISNGGTGFTKTGEEVYRVIVGEARPLGCAFTSNPAAAVQGVAIASEQKTVKIELEVEFSEKEEEGDDMESEDEEWVNKPIYDSLSEDEKKLADSLIELSDEVGPLDEAKGIWVGYVNEKDNPNYSIGVNCGNCALMCCENGCKVLKQSIEPGGNCRFAVIPDGLVKKVSEAKKNEDKTLNKPFRLPSGSKKKFGVYVKNDKGNIVMVKFGDPNMEIRRDNPEARKSFRARHQCDTNPGPKWKARYWSCRFWDKSPVSSMASQNEILELDPSLSSVNEVDEDYDESFSSENDDIISQEYKQIVKTTNIMKFKNIDELYTSLSNASLPEGITPQAIREFFSDQIKIANDSYEAMVKEKDSKEKELSDAISKATDTQNQLEKLQTELAEMKQTVEQESKQRLFDSRMLSLSNKYDLDEKVTKIIAKQIRDLDEESYNAWLEEDGSVILASREKQNTPVVSDITEGLKEAKASVEIIPNAGSDSSEKVETLKPWNLKEMFELK